MLIALVVDKGEVVLDHSEIKDFMDAMTMGYKVLRLLCSKGQTWAIKFVYI